VAIDATPIKQVRSQRVRAQARAGGKLMWLQEMQYKNFYAPAVDSISRHEALSARDRKLSEFGQQIASRNAATVRIRTAQKNPRRTFSKCAINRC
jgi:hypothetical protein